MEDSSNDPPDEYYQDNQELGGEEEEEEEEEEIDFSQMYAADGPLSDSVDNIDMKDLVPEYEPVEITPVEAQDDEYSNDEDEDGFNDVEEITDDMLDNEQSEAQVRVEDIKIEPDINMALLHQYM